jgi:hypothetical protein
VASWPKLLTAVFRLTDEITVRNPVEAGKAVRTGLAMRNLTGQPTGFDGLDDE